jgi:catechol 2,3-dioxygenase-like lactoylglutathione lyase family enzyme
VPTGKQTAHLDHLTILVRDADRSRNWHTTVLGLRVESRGARRPAIAVMGQRAAAERR